MQTQSRPPEYVTVFADRHGTPRPRFRRAGFSKYLPLDMASEAFRQEYEVCLATAPPTPIRAPKSAVGQLRAILRQHGLSGKGEFVYFVIQSGLVKIGFSSSIFTRIRQLSTQSPTRLQLAAAIPGGRAVERRMHEMFAADHVKGEWFRRSSELEELIAAIRKSPEHLRTLANLSDGLDRRSSEVTENA